MELNGFIEPGEKQKRAIKGSLKMKIIGLALAVTLTVGYTLAANINLGTNSSVEFGQGVLIATTCDDQILVKPGAAFDNQISKSFGVNALTVSDISNACIGKILTINFYGETASSTSNSHGPLALLLSNSGTAGLHFELVGGYSTPAIISSSSIDTLTAGMGNLGSTTFEGSSSVSLTRILSSKFKSYSISEVKTVTLQSSDASSIPSSVMLDDFISSCRTLSAANLEDLNEHLRASNSKVNQLLALADYADEAYAEFASFGASEKSERAQEFRELSRSGDRISRFIFAGLPLCEAHLISLVNAEADFDKIDALNESITSLNDAIDCSLVAREAFDALAGYASSYL